MSSSVANNNNLNDLERKIFQPCTSPSQRVGGAGDWDSMVTGASRHEQGCVQTTNFATHGGSPHVVDHSLGEIFDNCLF